MNAYNPSFALACISTAVVVFAGAWVGAPGRGFRRLHRAASGGIVVYCAWFAAYMVALSAHRFITG